MITIPKDRLTSSLKLRGAPPILSGFKAKRSDWGRRDLTHQKSPLVQNVEKNCKIRKTWEKHRTDTQIREKGKLKMRRRGEPPM